MTSGNDGGAAGEDGKVDPDVPIDGSDKMLNAKGGEKISQIL